MADGLRTAIAPFVTSDGQPSFTSPVTYPTDGELPGRLAALAAMLAAGLPIRCVAVEGAGAWDTHSDETATLASNLQQTVGALLAGAVDELRRGADHPGRRGVHAAGARAVRWPAVVLAAAVHAAPAAGEAKAPVKRKTVCHWVKATKKKKRHRVCRRGPVAGRRPAPTVTTSAPAAPSITETPAVAVAAPALADPGAAAPPGPDVVAPAPARIQVTAREYTLTLSRPTVPTGTLIAQLVNRGEDPHDLRLRSSEGGGDLLALDSVASGALATGPSTWLPAGIYTLYCALPGHEALGMHATLTVV